ncbi:MAG: class I SAM-dependent methyltransferase [Richelia sp. RM2_1_2]|nr:class I SAM-dependent methyltransferase [Richelia sp. RM2_1_2]
MVNFDKYKNDGWGLSKLEFEILYDAIKHGKKQGYIYDVVEFGSGRSTEFLIDTMRDLGMHMDITSFDDSVEFAYKEIHLSLKLNIVPLVDCDDKTFEQMFVDKKYDASKMKDKATAVHTRQKNTFYKIEQGMLPNKIDLLIVDGPHGNGRSLAYVHCANLLVDGGLVLIDDASHYPFYDH